MRQEALLLAVVRLNKSDICSRNSPGTWFKRPLMKVVRGRMVLPKLMLWTIRSNSATGYCMLRQLSFNFRATESHTVRGPAVLYRLSACHSSPANETALENRAPKTDSKYRISCTKSLKGGQISLKAAFKEARRTATCGSRVNLCFQTFAIFLTPLVVQLSLEVQ